jgi:hypothetical protein
VSLPTNTVPAFTVVPPANVFAPLNVNVPVPTFTIPPVAPDTTPDITKEPVALLTSTVRTPLTVTPPLVVNATALP